MSEKQRYVWVWTDSPHRDGYAYARISADMSERTFAEQWLRKQLRERRATRGTVCEATAEAVSQTAAELGLRIDATCLPEWWDGGGQADQPVVIQVDGGAA